MKKSLFFLCLLFSSLCWIDFAGFSRLEPDPRAESFELAVTSAYEEEKDLSLAEQVIVALQKKDTMSLNKLLYASNLCVTPEWWVVFMQHAMEIEFGQEILWNFVKDPRRVKSAGLFFVAAAIQSNAHIVRDFLNCPILYARSRFYHSLVFKESAVHGDDFVVHALLSQKSKITAADVSNALRMAVQIGQVTVVEEFLSHPDKVNVRVCATLAKSARVFGREKIADLLSDFVICTKKGL